MKGYVVVDVPEEVKQKIIDLRNQVVEWKIKPKQEVILFEKVSWWKSEWRYTVQIPDHLRVYLYDFVFSPKYYYFEVSERGKRLGELYHLVVASNPVYLGDELAREYNKLVGNIL